MTSVGTWIDLKKLEDPELQRLAAKLPGTVMKSRADATVKKYLGAFQRWETWASGYNFIPLPAKDYQVALYLQHLGDTSKSKAAVEEACNALAWVHSSSGLPSPTSCTFVQTTLQGLQRMLAKPVTKKTPVSVELLAKMVEDATKTGSLSDIRLATTCLLSFSGFLRFNELVNMRPCDIKIQEEWMTIHLPRSKMDQLRKGDELLIARTGNATCPVAMLEQYMRKSHTPWEDQRPLFRPICKSKNGERLKAYGSVSYSCMRDLFKKKLKALGVDPEEYGLHSLWAGGATAAANRGVTDRLFKRHGRWQSENAKDGYIDDSVEQRLEVSKNLGL